MKKVLIFLTMLLNFSSGVQKNYAEDNSMNDIQKIITVSFSALNAVNAKDKLGFSKCVDNSYWKSNKSDKNEVGFKKFKSIISDYRLVDDFNKQDMKIDHNFGSLAFDLKTGILKMLVKKEKGNWVIYKVLFYKTCQKTRGF